MTTEADTGPSLFEDLAAGLAAAGEPAMRRVVIAAAGARLAREFPADGGRLLVGRGPECDVVLAVAHASRRHFVLGADAGRISCHDARSRYGTGVERDGRRLQVPVEVIAGDRIVTAGDAVLADIIEVS
jgi:pSer/pThr/pTyr-binding forkhead associated (FHA) protein